MCGPRGLPGTRDFLFRNNGDGTFTEVAAAAGVDDKPGNYGFSPAWVDVDDDGWVDLIVVNDSTPNYLYINKHDGTFEDVSYIAGLALNQDGRELLSDKEYHCLEAALDDLKQVRQSTNHREIARHIEMVSKTSEEFAARRMNASIQKALTGHSLNEIEKGV